MSNDTPVPQSASRLVEELGDALASIDTVDPAAFELVAAVRRLVEATVMTEIPAEDRATVASEIDALTERLNTARRTTTFLLVRHPDGRPEHLTQAGTGRLNPQAPEVTFTRIGPPPPAGAPPQPTEVHMTARLTAAHAGSTGRAHGSAVAALLDEALGHAVSSSGAGGVTANLSIDFRGATPIDADLEIVGRYTHSEGRKNYATGEIRVDGRVTAEARAMFVSERRSRDQ